MKKIVVLMLLCIYLVGCSGQPNDISETSSSDVSNEILESKKIEKSEETSESKKAEKSEETSKSLEIENSKTISIEDRLQFFVNTFNDNNGTSLKYVEDFVPSDNSGSHYRTEFRLASYENAIGKSYLFGNSTVDIVAKDVYSGKIETRVYMDNATIEQCADMIRVASPIMDTTISNDEIQNTINYITENKEANGYYYANLGLTLSGNEEKGYELMLKND